MSKSLNADTFSISEVVVRAKTTVKVSSDSISYTVDSFRTNELSTTEDVLRKLPGVTVSENGEISVLGSPVSRVFINGRAYPVEDIRTITQNLPAEVLEKIQMIDWIDDDSQLSGLKGKDVKKAINLQFKEKYENIAHGRAGIGGGSSDRYQVGLFASYIGDELQSTLLGNINNTGIVDASNSDGGGQVQSTSFIPSINIQRLSNVHISFEPDTKLKIGASYEMANRNTEVFRSLSRTTYLANDSVLFKHQVSNDARADIRHNFSTRYEYKLNKRLTVLADVNVSLGRSTYTTDQIDSSYSDALIFSRSVATHGMARISSLRFSTKIQKTFNKDGRSFLLVFQAMNNDSYMAGASETHGEYYYSHTMSYGSLERLEEDKRNNIKMVVQFSEPLSRKSLLFLKYSNAFVVDKSNVYSWDISEGEKTLDTVQSKYYQLVNKEYPFELRYQYLYQKLTINAGLNVFPFNRSLHASVDAGQITSQRDINYHPSIWMKYNPTRQSNITISYDRNTLCPDIKQVQPTSNYLDSFNIVSGNPDLKPEINNMASLLFNYFDTRKQKILWATVQGNWKNMQIVNAIDINAARRTSTWTNVNGAYALSGVVAYSQYLLPKKLNAHIGLRSNFIRNIVVINKSIFPVMNYRYQPEFKFTFSVFQWCEGDIKYSKVFSNLSSSVNMSDAFMQQHSITMSGTLTLPRQIRIGYFVNYLDNIGSSQNADKNFFVLNGTIDKTFTKPKGLVIRIQAFDILNRYPSVQRTLGDTYIEDMYQRNVGRYLIFKAIYKFTSSPR